MTTTLDSLLTDLASGAVHVVDLTAPLSPSTPVLQLPAPFANTIPLSLEPVSNFDDDGPGWGWNNIHTGEHTGTHVDAPAHWATGRDGHTVDTIPPGRLVGPAVVLDFRDEVSRDPDFLLEPAHLDAHVAEHGPLPDGAWLVFRTGWSARNHDADAFLNADDSGPHTPGVSVAGGMDPMFPVHYHLLGADKYGVTQLQNLDRLPATGAVLVVSPLPIVGGTGSPARVLAFAPGAA